ncbi:MAG: ABC transporter ATP-binding protein/permease [Phycisphaerales bacterium]|nr:ABC transporter ATP-binding protein/permease [Phycisphaerales bacterium]
MRLLEQPETIRGTPYLNWAYTAFGFESDKAFLICSGVLVLLLFLTVNLVNGVSLWAQSRFTWMRSFSISRRLLGAYLSRPYSFFLTRNSADFTRSIYQEVRQVIIGIMIPSVTLLSRGISILLILALLLYVNPWLSIGIAVLFSATYTAVFMVSRNRLKEAGERIVAANEACYQITNEAFGGIKEAKLGGLESVFQNAFTAPGLDVARMNTRSAVIGGVPRYLLESIAFGSMLALLLIMIGLDYALSDIIPIASVFAFAGYRLMPALSQIFSSVAKIRASTASLDVVTRDIQSEVRHAQAGEQRDSLDFREDIRLDQVTLNYQGSKRPAISEVDLTIRHGESIAIVGSTGSGKSTLVDVLLGLLEPTTGKILVDGNEIGFKNARAWQDNLGYVPQTIFLSDDTVKGNIAFGTPTEEVDDERVLASAKDAGLSQLIENELEKGFETQVGERGVRLSGGQVQRLGIARALYRDPKVLFLDEATSALDSHTEATVMQGIRSAAKSRTVIIIAHRLSTVRFCDRIVVIDHGKVADIGTWSELAERCDIFVRLIGDQKPENS